MKYTDPDGRELTPDEAIDLNKLVYEDIETIRQGSGDWKYDEVFRSI